MNYQQGYEDGVRATKAEYLKLLEEESYPVKELTDEEIIKVYEDMLGVASAKGSAIDFAREVLRKAQEK